MKLHVCLLLLSFLCVDSLSAQSKDSVYEYDICIHQKSTPGTAHATYGGGNNSKSMYISIHVWDKENDKIRNCTASVYSKDTTMQAYLDTNYRYDFRILKVGTYDLKVSHPEYGSLIVKNIPVKEGGGTRFDVILGRPDAFITMTIKSSKKLNERQLKRKAKRIEKKHNTTVHVPNDRGN